MSLIEKALDKARATTAATANTGIPVAHPVLADTGAATMRQRALQMPPSRVVHNPDVHITETMLVERLDAALALKPDYVDAQAAMVNIELRAGRFPEAMQIAQQMQKQAAKSAAGFILEGDVLMALKL